MTVTSNHAEPSGAQPDSFVALDDTNKGLRHKLLAVPALRAVILATSVKSPVTSHIAVTRWAA